MDSIERPDGRYVWLEPHDKEATIDFAGYCQVRLVIKPGEPAKLLIRVNGLDDRATILMDESIELLDDDSETDEDDE